MLDQKIEPLKAVMTESKDKMDEVIESITFLSHKYDELYKRVEQLEAEKTAISSENKTLKDTLLQTTKALNKQADICDELEQYSRRDCVEIRGIPVKEDEDTNNLVCEIGAKIGIKLDREDISTSHRIPAMAASNRSPAIIVKFLRRDLRDSLYDARKKLKDLSSWPPSVLTLY